MFVDDENRRHQYIQNRVTGKAVRVYPNLNALNFSDGEEIGAANVERIARRVLGALEVFSGVDEEKLTLSRARKSKLGMWIVSFEQVHRGFLVYGARYGVTIGRNNTVLSVGGEVYDISRIQTHAIVTEEPGQVEQDLDLLEPGPAGGTVTVNDDPDLEVNPTITSSQVVQDLLSGSESAVIVDEPRLMIYPQASDAEVTYRMGWVASVDNGADSREVVVDAFSGTTLATESLVAHASYSRNGTVDGSVYPRNDHDTRVVSTFADLKVKAVRLDYGRALATDETDANGNYLLSWTSATANHKVGAELEGQYVSSVSDEDNPDLDHYSPTFALPYTGTYNWTWPDDLQYADQLNIFFHTNKMARWYESHLYNVTHKVELGANENTPGASAWTISGSTPRIEFSNTLDSERQADIIYHEYTHSVSYKLHGSFIGSSGQAAALEEGMADYFAQTLIGDQHHRLTSGSRNLLNDKRYPDDYSTSNSEHTNGLIPGGAAWHLRIDLGATMANAIVFAALEMDSPRADTFEEFFDNVLLADDDLYGNGYWAWLGCGYGWGDTSPHAGEIWDAFSENHGMPSSLLAADPDCSSSKPMAGVAAAAQAVEGVYPNPFNSSVSLRYRVDELGKVGVEVYSITGQLVRHLASEEVAVPGIYSVSWDGRSDGGAVKHRLEEEQGARSSEAPTGSSK